MLFQKSILLAKIEGAYGVDSTPAPAADAFITSVPTISVQGEHRERNVARAGFGLPVGINVGQGVQIEFAVELRGTTGLNDAPPKIFTLFRACNMTQTLVSLTSATLTPNSNHNGESLSLILNFDGIQHKILGCRGTFTIEFQNNNIVVVNFTFTGIYSSSFTTSVAFPTGTFDDTPELLLFKSAGLDINGNSNLIFENITFNPGNNIFRRPGSNAASGTHAYSIVSRAPEISLEPEAVALAELNPWNLYDTSEAFPVSFGVQDANNTPGQQFIFTFNNCQIKDSPQYGQRESLRTWPLTLIPHATIADGNDEFTISCSLPTES